MVAFVLVFVALHMAYTRWPQAEAFVIERLTVSPAAVLIDAFEPALGVQASGTRLQAPGGGLNVLRGCEGTEVAWLLCSAMLVAPIAWRWRLVGVAAALVFVFVANQIRVLSLFYAYRHQRESFEALHGWALPLLLVAAAVGFFVLWLQRFGASPQQV